MSMAHELEAGKWIKKQIQDQDSAHKAYLDLIPEVAGLPNYRYQCQRRNDVHTHSGHIAISVLYFLVVATVQGQTLEPGPNGLIAMVQNIEDALHLASGETTTARIGQCTRDESYVSTENVGGDMIRHAGGIYQVVLYGLPESE